MDSCNNYSQNTKVFRNFKLAIQQLYPFESNLENFRSQIVERCSRIIALDAVSTRYKYLRTTWDSFSEYVQPVAKVFILIDIVSKSILKISIIIFFLKITKDTKLKNYFHSKFVRLRRRASGLLKEIFYRKINRIQSLLYCEKIFH